MCADVKTSGTELERLVSRLAEAEAELETVTSGAFDAVVDSSGHAHLLRQAQQALIESESQARQQAALLDAILRSAPDLITYVGSDGTVRWTNGGGEQRAMVVGEHWLAASPPGVETEELRRLFEVVVSTGCTMTHEGPERGPAGDERWIARRFGGVVENGKLVGVVIVSRDRTHERNAERQLMVSDRMASVGTLAAGVAHEINNPLASVLMNVEMALQEIRALPELGSVRDTLVEGLGDARVAAERVRVIVRDLKVFSRVEDDERAAVDVARVMDSTLRMAWNEIRHRATLVKEYGQVPPVEASEARLGQVFLNLVVNAAQAIPEGNAERNAIRVSTSVDDAGRVVIRVADTGAGIPREVRSRLFTPFFTTKPQGVGTGLGLSICHRIVTSLGGDISFESEVGKGTEFRVVLPAARLSQAHEAAAPAPSLAPARRGRVLVVDDDVAITNATKRILGKHHDVRVANDPAEALAMVRDGNRFDVVLCDVMMPQMTGMDLLAEVERIDPDQAARFIFMTGGAFTPRARQFLDETPHTRIEKPFEVQAIKALVSSMVGRQAR